MTLCSKNLTCGLVALWGKHSQKIWVELTQIHNTPGVSMSRSRLSILTLSKCLSWQSRKSSHFQKVHLNNWELLISIKISQFCPDINVQTQMSQSKNLAWKFCHFLRVCLDLDKKLSGFLHINRWDFSICQDFLSFSYSKCLDNVEISWQFWHDNNLDRDQKKGFKVCLDRSRNLDLDLDLDLD